MNNKVGVATGGGVADLQKAAELVNRTWQPQVQGKQTTNKNISQFKQQNEIRMYNQEAKGSYTSKNNNNNNRILSNSEFNSVFKLITYCLRGGLDPQEEGIPQQGYVVMILPVLTKKNPWSFT